MYSMMIALCLMAQVCVHETTSKTRLNQASALPNTCLPLICFGERRTFVWYASCLLGVLAVVLSCLS